MISCRDTLLGYPELSLLSLLRTEGKVVGRRNDESWLRSEREFSCISEGRLQRLRRDPLYLVTESSSDFEHLLIISFREIGWPWGRNGCGESEAVEWVSKWGR